MNSLPFEEAQLVPLATDSDIEERVRLLIGRANVRQLWVMFVDSGEVQLPLLIPIDGLPASPTDEQSAGLIARLREVMIDIGASSVVMVWERYGAPKLTARDAVWVRSLSAACAAGGVKLRAMLLSHRTGVRWIVDDDFSGSVSQAGQPVVGGAR